MNGLVLKRTGVGFAVRAILGTMLVLALGACTMRGGKVPYAPADFGPPDRAQPTDVVYDLPLGPLDLLKITVFRVPELSGDYQVDAKGMLDLPLIGSVNVRDQSSHDFAKLLEQQYGARYLNNPEITVRVMTTPNNNITVEGGVNSPGIYGLPGRTTLVGAIALARGIAATDANARRVMVFRKRDGATMAAAFDLVSIRRGEMADPVVYPGDTIVVDTSQLRPVYRDLLQSIPILAIFLRL